MERPGYIARTIYGIDELRFEFEHQIEEDLLSGNLQLDGQLQRLLHLFEQTLEVCSASLGSMQLASPGDVQGSISDAVHSGPEEIGDILLIKENDAGHSSSTSRRIPGEDERKQFGRLYAAAIRTIIVRNALGSKERPISWY
jgi:hypothetical protein